MPRLRLCQVLEINRPSCGNRICVFYLCQYHCPCRSGRPSSSNPWDDRKKGRCPSRSAHCEQSSRVWRARTDVCEGPQWCRRDCRPTVLVSNCLPGGFLVSYFLPLQLDSCLHWERQNHVPQLGGSSSSPFRHKWLWHRLQMRNEWCFHCYL